MNKATLVLSAISACAAAAQVAATEITAAKLYEAYVDNEILAEDSYNGSPVTVTGVVKAIEKSMMGDPVVKLEAGSPTSTVRCVLHESEKAAVETIEIGDRVRFDCMVDNRMGDAIHLSGCMID